MPVIAGKVVRSRFTSLKLGELSGVDRPAQPGALAAILKRDPQAERDDAAQFCAKYVCETDGAHTFSEVLRENKFSTEIWPCTDALTQSIRSIVGDSALSGSEREAKINASVEEFLSAVREISGEVGKRLEELISKREVEMPKTVEQLEGDLAKMTARAEKAEADLAAAQSSLKAMTDQKDEACEELDKTKKALVAATDETIKVAGEEVKKSEVGEQNFRVLKLQDGQIQTARLEKRATDELPNLAGSVTHKAALLGAIERISDEETRKAAEQILASAQKMARAGFERLGKLDHEGEPVAKASVQKFNERIDEVQKRDDCTRSEAMSKARSEFPEDFAAYQSAGN